jgi:hypothetical protein
MLRLAIFATILGACALLTPADAQTDKSGATELSAQTRTSTRLRVYPGRLLYRDCNFWLAQEWRPSGPVVVPRQRCWWVRG